MSRSAGTVKRGFSLFKAIAFTLAACGAWIMLNTRNLQEFFDTFAQRNQELEDIELVEQRIHLLQKRQLSLKANGIEMEKQVRERWMMHLPGEQVIYLKGPTQTTSTAASSTRPDSAQKSAAKAISGASPENKVTSTPKNIVRDSDDAAPEATRKNTARRRGKRAEQ